MFMVFYSMFHNWLSDRYQIRFWFFIYPIPISIVGFIVFMTTSTFGPRYFSLFLMNFVFAMNGTLYGWIASSIPRPPAKRAAAYAFINSIGNSASIWTPYTYRDEDKPYYRPALGICMAMQAIALIASAILWFNLRSANRRLERMENEDSALTEKDLEQLRKTASIEGVDIAAARRLQKGFRFVL